MVRQVRLQEWLGAVIGLSMPALWPGERLEMAENGPALTTLASLILTRPGRIEPVP